MKLKQIKNNDELKLALSRVEEIWNTNDFKELAELDNLATLISDFEDKLLFLERKNQSECKPDIKDL